MSITISWFAGLFYLPRIFVNIAQQDDNNIKNCLIGMAKRLYNFMHLLSVGVIISGIMLYLSKSPIEENVGDHHKWMYLKLVIVFMTFIYQQICNKMIENFEKGLNKKSHNFYRVFNEIPLIFLITILSLVTIKPF
ncbi:membrane protein [Candidatus Kinetoplastibacterium crithidii (ex Angomonas deanei ATCC 30255)]|nr:membrane protein [Candidatus Kinetoplastibacterium crithidii (ex Angomonas deanei ATCC 30255)]